MSFSLRDRLAMRYMTHLTQTSEGRSHLLTQLADAEDNDEGRLFDRVLARVDDPRFEKLVRRHQSDEKRHAALFRECAARTGVTPVPVPDRLQMLPRLDRALGARFDQAITSRIAVMQAYVVLQVLEERAVTQFPMFQAVFARFDPKTAAVLASVAVDEARHLKYCHAIARHYAPSPAVHAATLADYRQIEAQAFSENSRDNVRYTMEQGLVRVSPVEGAFWKGLTELTVRTGGNRTPYFGAAPERPRADRDVSEDLAMAA